MKKKVKRVDASKAIGSAKANRLHQFCDSGAPVSMLLLAGYTLIACFILSLQMGAPESSYFVRPDFSAFFRILALMTMLSTALGLYIGSYQPRLLNQHCKCLTLLMVMLGMILFIHFGAIFGPEKFKLFWSPYLFVVPVMVASITVTISFTQRFALGVGCFLSLLAAISLGENAAGEQMISVLAVTGTGMGISILSLNDIRTRTKLIRVCFLAGVVVLVMVWAMGIWRQEDFWTIGRNSLYGFLGSVFVGVLMQGLLPYIEKAFKVATNMTLLDYAESSQPLLRRLAVEAPGTFNHSWQIGMMSEAAAEEIGANGLLCRVGAYYHDIGKINKPHFFVENQGESFNQHRGLSPTMSKMIIIGHVKDGVEMAKEYKLPKILQQFIATHHGTTLVEFFYHQACKDEEGKGRIPDETEFRYPGPKPQTKEAAVIMLCDCIESATRAMKDPTPSRIEDMVNSLLMKRLLDGQFDECDLTMRELKLIENRIVKTLCGMYHGRIAYPKVEKVEKHGNGNSKKQDPKSKPVAETEKKVTSAPIANGKSTVSPVVINMEVPGETQMPGSSKA